MKALLRVLLSSSIVVVVLAVMQGCYTQIVYNNSPQIYVDPPYPPIPSSISRSILSACWFDSRTSSSANEAPTRIGQHTDSKTYSGTK